MNAISLNYIKSEEVGTDLDYFVKTMKDSNMAPVTIRRHVKSVRICMDLLRKDVHTITTDDLDDLSDKLIDRSESTKDSYILSFRRFCKCCTGVDPGERRGRMHKRLLGRMASELQPYISALERFESKLRASEKGEVDVAMTIKCTRHCLKMIVADKGPIELSSIDKNTLYELEGKMNGLKRETIRRYLISLGMFVFSETGKNPYQDYIVGCNLRKKPKQGCRLDSEIEAFTQYSWRKGDKEHTYRQKAQCIVRCIQRLDRLSGPIPLDEIDHAAIVELIRDMQMSGLKSSTIVNYLNTFGGFLKEITGNNPIDFENLPISCSETKRIFIFKEDFKKMLDAANVEETLIISLGATYGLRAGEMVNIKLDDIQGDKLIIRGKGHGFGKVVTFDLSPMILGMLDDYMDFRNQILQRFGDGSKGQLFINSNVNKGTPMTVGTIEDRITSLGARVGVVITSHSLRRLFCTTLYDLGEDEVIIQKMMRHSNILTTRECYYYADPRKISKAKNSVQNELFT